MANPFQGKNLCTECGKLIIQKPKGGIRVTCSKNCRSKRSRRKQKEERDRQKAVKQAQLLSDHQAAVNDVVQGRVPDVANGLIKEEMRPIIREAITDDVLGAIKTMVNLAPQAVAALALDMKDPKPAVRQKAYTLWFQYTVGQQGLHSPDKDGKSGDMTIVFDMPRPPANGHIEDAEIIEEAARVCENCGVSKPESDFIESSDRCKECQAALTDQIRQRLGEGIES